MLKRIKEELEKDDKLKKSSLAQETFNFIEKLTTKSVESIKDFFDITFDQEGFKEGLKDETKTLSQLGKYLYWIAKSKKSDNMYAMSHQEAAASIYEYFTKPLPEAFLNKGKPKEDKKVQKKKAKAVKKLAKKDKKDIFLKIENITMLSDMTSDQLKDMMKTYKVKGTIEPLDKQEGLVKVSEEDQMRALIEKHVKKHTKVTKVVKKVVKEESTIDNQVSLFDEGEF